MLNFGISQNNQISLQEVEGEEYVFDLSLYQEFGDQAYKYGREEEALSWYTKGLAAARDLGQKDKIDMFSHLILSCL
jgi:hypothetical protein